MPRLQQGAPRAGWQYSACLQQCMIRDQPDRKARGKYIDRYDSKHITVYFRLLARPVACGLAHLSVRPYWQGEHGAFSGSDACSQNGALAPMVRV